MVVCNANTSDLSFFNNWQCKQSNGRKEVVSYSEWKAGNAGNVKK